MNFSFFLFGRQGRVALHRLGLRPHALMDLFNLGALVIGEIQIRQRAAFFIRLCVHIMVLFLGGCRRIVLRFYGRWKTSQQDKGSRKGQLIKTVVHAHWGVLF